MAHPLDIIDPNDPYGLGLSSMPPQVFEQGGFDPSVGGMVPGFGTQGPGTGEPPPPAEEPMPNDFWSRLAMGAGSQPFSFRPRKNPTGLEVMLAALAGFGNVKAGLAAGRISKTEEENKRIREAAKEMANRRWSEQERKKLVEEAKANIRLTASLRGEDPLEQVMGPGGKPTFARRAEAVGREAFQGPEKTLADIQAEAEARARGAAAGAPAERLKLKLPTAAERGDLIDDVSMLKQIGDVRSLFGPNYVGPGHGIVGRGTQMVGAMTRKESMFRGALSGIGNRILKMRSGGAVTTGEAQRLMDELPTLNNPPGVFQSKLDQFESAARYIASTRREVLSATGVDLSRLPTLPEAKDGPSRIRVIGPNGEKGTVDASEPLPAGWKKAP